MDKGGERQDGELRSHAALERHKASAAVIQRRQTARFVCHVVLCGDWLLFYSFPPSDRRHHVCFGLLIPLLLSLFLSLKHLRVIMAIVQVCVIQKVS